MDAREIKELLTAQLNHQIPDTPDIPYPRVKRNKVYTLQQSYVGPSVIGNAATETDGTLNVTLSALPDASSLAAIFDTYRFVAVKMTFQPSSIEANAAFTAPIYTVIDYDDSATTAVSALVQYDTLMVVPGDQYFERTFKPRVANAVYSGAFTSFGQLTEQWIDTASSGVQHYGIKWGIPLSGSAPSWQTTIHCIVQFKNTR